MLALLSCAVALSGVVGTTGVAGLSNPVEAYNNRPLDGSGLRRLRLELSSAGRVTRRFDVVHAWRREPREIRSLVFLEEPAELRGTSYLWVEGPGVPGGLEVFLRLPAGQRRVLRLVAGRFEQGLLGSDFAYTDLLWQIPTLERRLSVPAAARLDEVPMLRVDSTAVSTGRSRWERLRYFLSSDGAALHAVDYFDRPGADAEPVKRLRAFDLRPVGQTLMPARMVMETGAHQRSVLLLVSVALNTPGLERALFQPDALGVLAAGFEQGTPHAAFRHPRP